MIKLLTKKDYEIAEKYGINADSTVISRIYEGTNPILLTELTYVYKKTNEPTEFKRIIAFELHKDKETNKWEKHIVGELDYFSKKTVIGTLVGYEDYWFKNRYAMKQMVNYLENQAIDMGAVGVRVRTGSSTFYQFGEHEYSPINPADNMCKEWGKTNNLKFTKFPNNYQKLDCTLSSAEENEKV